MARRLYLASLALTPSSSSRDYVVACRTAPLSSSSPALALIPLAYLIGEATEHVAEHTGPGIGGFLNASFGNAPELIISLLRDQRQPAARRPRLDHRLRRLVRPARPRRGDGLRRRRRASTAVAAPPGRGARASRSRSSCSRRSPAGPASPTAHTLYLLTLPVAAVLLVLYLVTTRSTCAAPSRAAAGEPAEATPGPCGAASRRSSSRRVATAFVSRRPRRLARGVRRQPRPSQFFVAAVIVALVGNAAEHGGAIVTARRGQPRARRRDRDLLGDPGGGVRRARRSRCSRARRRGAPARVPPDRDRDDGRAPRSRSRLVIFDARAKRWEGVRAPRRLRRWPSPSSGSPATASVSPASAPGPREDVAGPDHPSPSTRSRSPRSRPATTRKPPRRAARRRTA